jgi:hypothetical protein
MRLTTKIIIGAILSTFLISVIFIISISFFGKKNSNRLNAYNIELSQDNITGIELSQFNTIVIDVVPYESNKEFFAISDDCHIYFDSITEQDNSDMMFIPESFKDFVSTATYGDTLNIKLDLFGIGNKYKSVENGLHAISGLNINFRVSKIDVINNMQYLKINAKNIVTDSIKIHSDGDIFIDYCKAQYIEPVLKSNHFKLNITNSEAKRVHLDLDYVQNRNIMNSNIEEEYMTGSRTRHITWQRNKSGKINWVPKDADAELIIKIQGEPTQILFP